MREWSQRELARQAGISHSAIANVVAEQRKPTWDFCAAIAKPLDKTPMEVFQLAGLLQKGDLDQSRAEYYARSLTEEEAELVELYRSLPSSNTREFTLRTMRSVVKGFLEDE